MSEVKMETTDETEQAANNGDAMKEEEGEKMETTNGTAATADGDEEAEYAENEVYKKLRSQNVKPKVAVALLHLYEATDMSEDELDERAIEMLRGLPVDHALFVIKEVEGSKLIGVQNKAQFLMAVMRNFRDKVRQLGSQVAISQPLVHGPDASKIKEILERTGYPLEVTIGQRKYGGPPPDWDGPASGPAGPGHEIYVGKIPKEVFEDTLIALFEEVGKIWDLRLMMDPLTGRNRGYAFVTFCDKAAAAEASKKFDGHEILPGKNLKVNVSVANTRLFIGNIPKSKSKEEIIAEFKEHTEGVVDCIIYTSPDAGENRKNRGFCFLDFCDHKTASDAKRKIHAGKLRPWNSDLVVDWAEQQEEPDEETMSKVKVLYVRNLKEAVTEDQLKEMFAAHGEVERAKKIRDYAFIHFKEREPAIKAMEALNGTILEGIAIDITLAKPQGDKKKTLRGRGRGFGSPRSGFGDFGGGFGMRGGMMRGRGGPGGFGPRGGFGGPADYGYGGYDPYAGYDDMYGYGAPPAGYGGYGGFDAYGYGGPDPYTYGYGGPAMGGRSGSRGGMGFMSRGSGGRGRGGSRGGRGTGPRGAKRPGDGAGGPASKREFGNDDFSADVNMASF
ncbi:Heterogeneous nuclear ribonucleoprotein Q [Toxocara canis]|uniref:Heterogeneous nuclear ribonucleoprotein Q n=1 Tax=Toxocara canis TaxID=6265 RepID=A0A0B2VY34_TOXCA|nr:Heterogeneous nuclear ribonucleoprotein Q [Toxocara canis]